ncbi:DUF456 domain-containing protein [Aquimarina addita]|uniref:DUF456 domain-containing protein n=1 Tax=Aquimarina addita TaxID=870485 RepID=A0ABP6US43_9FLAO
MDIALVIIGLVLCFIGIIGSFLPVLPGPFTSWTGLLLLHLTSVIPQDWTFLGITLGISVFVWILDYIVPAWGTKQFGGSRYGMIGSSIGLLIGLFVLGPFGIIIGPFAGAYLGELMKDANDSSRALKAAVGSFLGFLAGTFVKLIVTIVFIILYCQKVWEYREVFLVK